MSGQHSLQLVELNQAVRADLAATQPMYYPIVEQARYGGIKAMCNRHGWPLEQVAQFVQRAALEMSSVVVIDRLVMGPPELKMAAVLVMNPGGSVVLCCGLFDQVSEDRVHVESVLEAFNADPDFKGKLLAIGEFRPNQKRAAS
jgi:hypothetical protein